MKVKHIVINHIKGARHIEIRPSRSTVELAGKNGAGKTSTLDCLKYAFSGARYHASKMVTEGESEGDFFLDLGELTISQKFSAGKTHPIVIKPADGSKKGQLELNDLFNTFSFELEAFAQLSKELQIATVKKLAGNEFVAEIDKLDAEIQIAYDERKTINAQVKKFGKIPKVEEVKEINVEELSCKVRDVEKLNTQNRTLGDARRILQRDIEALELELAKKRTELSSTEEPKPLIDMEPLYNELKLASANNQKHIEYQKYLARIDEYSALNQEANKADANLKTLRESRKKLITGAKFGIEGISFTEDNSIEVNGIPFEELSDGEKIKLSCTIGALLHPELRVLLIRKGSLLDVDNFRAIETLAMEHDLQIWIETVGDGHGDAIHIEDGRIRGEAPF